MATAGELQQSSHHINNSVAWLLLRLIGGLFLIETAYVVFLVLALTPLASQYHFQVTIGLWILHTFMFLVIVAFILTLVRPWGSTQYYLANNQLVMYSGVSRRDENAYDLTHLKTVRLRQGWFGRMFNYGDIHLVFASSGYSDSVVLNAIYDPKKYERVLREFLSQPKIPVS